MEDEGLLGSIKSIANISKYSRYVEENVGTNWGMFAILFFVGGLLIVISLPFASFILINPKPFCMMFSLGSMVTLLAILQIIPISQLFKKASLLASIIYFTSLAMSLYAGMFQIGYLRTMGVTLTQV